MSLNELMSEVFEADEGERFQVDKIGYLVADKVKKENASLDTVFGNLYCTVVLDFDGQIGAIGYDKNGIARVLVHRRGDWHGSPLTLKDQQGKQVILFVGNNGFEVKELAVKEGKEIEGNESDAELIRKLTERSPDDIEGETKEGDTKTVSVKQEKAPVIIKDNESNKEAHPELIGKLGYIVKEYHSPKGLRFDVSVGKSVYNLDWRDVKGRD